MPYRKILSRVGSNSDQIEFLTTIVNNLPVAVFCKDAEDDMRVLIWNKSAEKIFGLAASEVIGKNVHETNLAADEARQDSSDDYLVAKKGEEVFIPDRTFTNKRTNEQVNFKIWKVPINTQHGKLVLCIAQDTTEVKKAETETLEQERRLKSISTNVPGLLYQFKMDPDGKFSFPFFSKQSSELLGVHSDDIHANAEAIINLIHKDDMPSFEHSLLMTIKDLTPWRWEGRFFAVDKGMRWFQGASTPIRQPDGSIVWDGMLFDVTAQKLAEEKLRLQEAQLAGTSKLVALGEMAGGVAHEINTPLNAILFCAEQIQVSLTENSYNKNEVVEMSELISETAQRIAKIVRGLKIFARDGSTESFEIADLSLVVDQAIALCSQRMQQNGVKFDFIKPDQPVTVSCRTVQLGQVILNLLNNSFDSVSGSTQAWIKIEIKSDSHSAYIEVTDSGAGLSPEVKEKLFQPFFTTKGPGKGTGLGLSISKGIMEAHEGQIFVDEEASNTKFVVELPLQFQKRGIA